MPGLSRDLLASATSGNLRDGGGEADARSEPTQQPFVVSSN